MKRLSYISLCFLSLALFPLRTYADGRSDAILRSLSEKVASLGSYRVGFHVEVEDEDADGEYVVSGNKFYIKVGDMEVICDGKARYEVNNEDEEVLIDKVRPDDRNIITNPTKGFEFADDIFTHGYKGEMTVDGKACDVVELRPRDPESSTPVTMLYVDKKTGLPVKLEYAAEGIDGDVEITIKSMAPDTKIPASRFVFNKKDYPGYELIDFRF